MTVLKTSFNRNKQRQIWFLVQGRKGHYVVLIEERSSTKVCPSLWLIRCIQDWPYMKLVSKRTKDAKNVIAECKRTEVTGDF